MGLARCQGQETWGSWGRWQVTPARVNGMRGRESERDGWVSSVAQEMMAEAEGTPTDCP